MSNASKVLIALVGGIAAGAVLGILFAPDKGSETRRKINESIDDVTEKLKKTGSKLSSGFKSNSTKKETDEVYA
jgi:gas vesicle protein